MNLENINYDTIQNDSCIIHSTTDVFACDKNSTYDQIERFDSGRECNRFGHSYHHPCFTISCPYSYPGYCQYQDNSFDEVIHKLESMKPKPEKPLKSEKQKSETSITNSKVKESKSKSHKRKTIKIEKEKSHQKIKPAKARKSKDKLRKAKKSKSKSPKPKRLKKKSSKKEKRKLKKKKPKRKPPRKKEQKPDEEEEEEEEEEKEDVSEEDDEEEEEEESIESIKRVKFKNESEISESSPNYFKKLFKKIISCGTVSEEEDDEEEDEEEQPKVDEEVEKYKADKRKHYWQKFQIDLPSDEESDLDKEARTYKKYNAGFSFNKLATNDFKKLRLNKRN